MLDRPGGAEQPVCKRTDRLGLGGGGGDGDGDGCLAVALCLAGDFLSSSSSSSDEVSCVHFGMVALLVGGCFMTVQDKP